jgi:hypothetical protein
MDYEELYGQMRVIEKKLRDKISGYQDAYRNVARDSERGDLKGLAKDLAHMGALMRDFDRIVAGYSSLIEGFDAREYVEGGDFTRQLTGYCESMSVDIKGEYPSYEIFPHKVRIDGEAQELIVDGKRTQSLRPKYFVESIRKSRDRLKKAPFNVSVFLGELAEAYDTAILRKKAGGGAGGGSAGGSGGGVGGGSSGGSGGGPAGGSGGSSGKTARREYDIHLKDLHAILAPMQRHRRDYDMRSYAFDLARLYNSDIGEAKDGRLFEFGSSRHSGKLIRILDKNGKEQYLGTIRFYGR